jgi:hypothetical protein
MPPRNPYEDITPRTALGRALAGHHRRFSRNRLYRIGAASIGEIDTIASRSGRDAAIALKCREMGLLLIQPYCYAGFKERFMSAYDRAFLLACPLYGRIVRESRKLSGVSWDYTLPRFDPAFVHALEEEASSDPTIAAFLKDIVKRLDKTKGWVDTRAWRQAFEIYSEAAVYRMIRDAGRGTVAIRRIPEADASTPDFVCELLTRTPPKTFYVEVKTLDIVDADQRHDEMLDEGMLAQDDLDRQVAAGERVAMAMREVAPYHRYGQDAGYDPRSVRMSIDRLIGKCRQAFKAPQFALGPTFALANLLRMPLHDGGDRPLAPFAYDPHNGGACVSGALWNVCFGHVGDPIHRWPDLEGAGTTDGRLQREGLLVGDTPLDSPGVIFLRRGPDGDYRLDGLYDPYWKTAGGWSNIETEEVLFALCRRFNDAKNTQAHELSNP